MSCVAGALAALMDGAGVMVDEDRPEADRLTAPTAAGERSPASGGAVRVSVGEGFGAALCVVPGSGHIHIIKDVMLYCQRAEKDW